MNPNQQQIKQINQQMESLRQKCQGCLDQSNFGLCAPCTTESDWQSLNVRATKLMIEDKRK